LVFHEPLSDDDDDDEDKNDKEESDGSVVGISRVGTEIRIGVGKLIMGSRDLDFKLVGLKFKAGDAEFNTELVGEVESEHGYDAVLELKLLVPKFSLLNTLRELDHVRTKLSFRVKDPLEEKELFFYSFIVLLIPIRTHYNTSITLLEIAL
jgi:hypothetical protein